MIKLLIADDEPLVLAGMKSMLPWNRLGLEICGTAQNGQQALELIRQYRPEIVITDIKMPVMTGLELAQHCRAEFGDLRLFIMLTSFEEFSYVREAMHHGAIEYIVKLELTPQSLEMTVRKAMEMVAKIQNKASSGAPAASLQLFRDKFFTRLCNNMFENREQFCRQHEDLGLQFDAERYVAASCSITNVKDISAQQQLTLCSSTVSMVQDILKKLCTCQVTILDARHFNIVFWMTAEQAYDLEFQNHLLQTASDTASRYFSVRLLCGIGTPVEDPFLIAQSVYSARWVLAAGAAAQPGLSAQQGLGHQDALFDFSAYRLRLTKAFEELDGTVLEQTISDIIDSLEGHPSRHIQALDAATNLLYMSLSLLPEGGNAAEQYLRRPSRRIPLAVQIRQHPPVLRVDAAAAGRFVPEPEKPAQELQKAGGGERGGVYPPEHPQAPDPERGGRGLQLQPQLPEPAVRQIRRARLCGYHHLGKDRRRQGDAGRARYEDLRGG